MTTFEVQLLAMLHQPVILTMVLAPLGLISLDIASGIASALKHGTFSWKILPSFLGNDLFRYIGGFLLIFGAYTVAGSELASLFFGLLGMGPLSAGIVASIQENWQELLGIKSPLAQLIGAEASKLQQRSMQPIAPGTALFPAIQKTLSNQYVRTQEIPAYTNTSPTTAQKTLIIKDPMASWMQ